MNCDIPKHNILFQSRMQQRLEEKVAESAKYYGINFNSNNSAEDVETEDSNEPELDGEGLDADLATGNKDTCVLEVSFSITSISEINLFKCFRILTLRFWSFLK